ncbi:ABC transporter ATP-binding protein [Sedimenticola sp.]|uniref:ABC transporter ATP-binding protein n=1 Tax=Sedimenticola sp. TaxID=1940285 RepID=UPI00258E7895|nr:ATP-binding cassette domain-containing protein [Sedimenticola sp.]MCW8905184.1 ATP-binding cassette domain-containing protein [Sedimenticola sp.]
MRIDVRQKAYRQQRVLGKIRFNLDRGETTALYGPSGCGKTTLLRIIAGLDNAFDGVVANRDTQLGFVFQEPRLLPWLSVYDNVALVAPDKPARIQQLLFEVGLQEVATLEASRLSLGMARRVSLARALVREPELLILDEPFNSLDQARAAQLRLLLLEIIERHDLKVLLVTHDPREALQLAQRILILGGQPTSVQREIAVGLSAGERRDPAAVDGRMRQLFNE